MQFSFEITQITSFKEPASAVTFVTMSSLEVCRTLAAVITNRVNTLGSILAGILNFALIHV